jgi:hypothetical protein
MVHRRGGNERKRKREKEGGRGKEKVAFLNDGHPI